MMSNSTRCERPRKPYPDFPLCFHGSGKFCKKIRGEVHYFGQWAKRVNGDLVAIEGDAAWKEALEEYRTQADDLHAGRMPRAKTDGELTVADLCNKFWNAQKRKLESGELGKRMFLDYTSTTDLLVKQFTKQRLVSDLRPDDFANLRGYLSERFGVVRLGNEIGRLKTVFKYALDNQLIDRPVVFGTEFKKPSKATLRKHRQANGIKMLSPDEIRTVLDSVDPTMKAMILLGINCGFGNADVSKLVWTAIDLETGWVNFPRPKTAIPRRCPLWPETIEALRAVERKSELVFLTTTGKEWVRTTDRGHIDILAMAFRRLLQAAGIHRPGCGSRFGMLSKPSVTVPVIQLRPRALWDMRTAP
jgi:integrase